MFFHLLKIILFLAILLFIIIGLFAVSYVAGFTLLISIVLGFLIKNNLASWIKIIFQAIVYKNKNKKGISNKKLLSQPSYYFKGSFSRNFITVGPICLIIIISWGKYKQYQDYNIQNKENIYLSSTALSSGDILIRASKKFNYGGSTSLYPIRLHELSETLISNRTEINTNLNLSQVVKSYQVNVAPINKKLKEFHLKEELKLDIDKTKINPIFSPKITKRDISENYIVPDDTKIKEGVKEIIKLKTIENLLNFSKPIIRQVNGNDLGFMLRELYIAPLNLNSSGEFVIPMDSSSVKLEICQDFCPTSIVELNDFPIGSFYQAKDAKDLKFNSYLDTETINWSLGNLNQGIKIAYIPPPFYYGKRFIEPFLKFFYINKWFIVISGTLISVSFFKPILQAINIKAIATAESKAMNESTDQSRKNVILGGTINASGAGALGLGDVSGTVANTINQMPASSKADKPGIKELLEQLRVTIEAESALEEKSKVKALKLVEKLALAATDPQEEAMKENADTAILALKGIISGLSDVAKLAEAGKTLLPMIAKLFGLG